MKAVRPNRIAIYVRWSTDDQSEGTTLEVQLEGCRHYALSQGWTPQETLTFIDDGYSGGSLDRPALARLRAQVAAGAIDCVIVFKVDRLSRNIVDAVDLVLGEWRETCFFKSAREPIDTSTDLGRMIFSILAMFADFERSQIRERTQSGKIRRIAEGRQLHGEPAFGYRPSGVTGQWSEAPDEALLVRRMFRLAAAGASAAAICRTLNGEGVRTRAGKAWSVRSVAWILRNRTYIGEAIYGRTQVKGGARRVRRAEPLVWTPTLAAPPLVERQLFDQVQAELERHRSVRQSAGARALGSAYLLVGLGRCPCGVAVAARRNGTAVSYYCPAAREGRCGHQPGYIAGRAAEQLILTQFWERYGPGALEPDRLERLARAAGDGLAEQAARRAALEQQLVRLAGQERRLLLAAATGEVALSDLGALRAALAEETALVGQQVASLQPAPAASPSLAADPATAFACLPAPVLRALLLSALAGPVVLHKPRGARAISARVPWAELAPPDREALLDRLARLLLSEA